MTKQDLYTYLQHHIHAVISTCGSNMQPESALIGFGQTENLEIIFGTNVSTRKYNNILENPHVSLVIGWEDAMSLQYQGIVEELTKSESEEFVSMYHQKVPSAAKYFGEPGQKYFKITPSWIRFTDYKNVTTPVQEFRF